MSRIALQSLLPLGLIMAALFTPAPLVAQTPASLAAVPVATAPEPAVSALAGPRVHQAGVSRSVAVASPDSPPQFQGDRRDIAWMVVGGAALVVGSLVGGDGGTIIMITGGVIGLLGLFRYMQ